MIPLAKFMGEFYFAMICLWALMIAVGFLVLGPRIARLISLMVAPLSTAFATASSEAAFPKVLEGLEHFGVSKRVAGFVLPLGYSFNLDGSMIYCTFAALFIAQATASGLSFSQQLVMLLLFMVTSKGIAGVPRASLVVIAATHGGFGIPEAGMAADPRRRRVPGYGAQRDQCRGQRGGCDRRWRSGKANWPSRSPKVPNLRPRRRSSSVCV